MSNPTPKHTHINAHNHLMRWLAMAGGGSHRLTAVVMVFLDFSAETHPHNEQQHQIIHIHATQKLKCPLQPPSGRWMLVGATGTSPTGGGCRDCGATPEQWRRSVETALITAIAAAEKGPTRCLLTATKASDVAGNDSRDIRWWFYLHGTV